MLLSSVDGPSGPDRVAALARRAPDPGDTDPATESTACPQAALRAWFASVLDVEDGPELLAVGHAAFLACEGPRRWPDVLLADDPPDDFVAAMRAATPPLTPPERPATMVEQSLDPWSASDLKPSTWLGRLLRPIVGDVAAG